MRGAALERLDAQGCARYVVTDVAKDGTMKGPSTHLLREVLERTSAKVIASGGISTIEDVKRVSELSPYGVIGFITGRALYEGTLRLEQAIQVAGKTS